MNWENPWGMAPGLASKLRTLPQYLAWSVVGFISGWVQTRHMRDMLLGLPALALAFPVCSLTLNSRAGLSSENIRRYIHAAQEHLKHDRLEQAEFYVHRLKSVKYESDQLLLAQAEIAKRKDEPEVEAACFAKMLANSDDALDYLAHRQMAIREMKSTTQPHSPEATQAIEHLEAALKLNPADAASHELLTKLFLAQGNLMAVARHLEPVAKLNPSMQIELARIYERIGRPSKMAQAAANAEAYFKELIATRKGTWSDLKEEDKKQWITNYLNWSESQLMQGKTAEAAEAMTSVLEDLDAPEFRKQLASIYLRLAQAASSSDSGWKTRWNLVILSRSYNPNDPESLVILANIAAHAPLEVRQMALREIQPYLDNGTAPPSAYYLIGTAAAESKQWDIARQLLRKSLEINPRAHITWNNLAYTFYSQPEPDLPEAERCINEALRLNPTPAAYHETRGQIMLALQRWPQVIQELELARLTLPPQAKIHFGLSQAYEQLGDEDLAAYHRTRFVALSRQ